MLGIKKGIIIELNQGICKIKSYENSYLSSSFKIGEYNCNVIALSGMILSIEIKNKIRNIGGILIKTSKSIKNFYEKINTKSKLSLKKNGICINISVETLLGSICDTLGVNVKKNGENKNNVITVINDKNKNYIWPIECESAEIINRESINEALESGILMVDGLIPIGLGQRELILGDRITGKTCIAVDIILNQKRMDVLCIYNSIGLKAGSILYQYSSLFNRGGEKYTIMVSSSSSCCSISQYLCSNTSTAICEYFLYIFNCNTMVVYDDLSKHAIATREIYLLLGRPPGREAYPGGEILVK